MQVCGVCLYTPQTVKCIFINDDDYGGYIGYWRRESIKGKKYFIQNIFQRSVRMGFKIVKDDDNDEEHS